MPLIDVILAGALCCTILITASFGIYILLKVKNSNNWWSRFGIILGYYYIIHILRFFTVIPNIFLKNRDIFQINSFYINTFTTYLQQALILSMPLDNLSIASQKSVSNPHLIFLISFLTALGCFYAVQNQLMLTICSFLFAEMSFTITMASIIAVFCCGKKYSQTNFSILKFSWIPLFLSLLFLINFGFQFFEEMYRIRSYSHRSDTNPRKPLNPEYREWLNIITEIVTLFGSLGIFLYLRNKEHPSESPSAGVVTAEQQNQLL